MKGLILKDIYQLKSYTRAFVVVILFCILMGFSGKNAVFLTYYPGLIMGMMPITLYAYDEKAKFHTMLSSLPVKKSTYVTAKYILGFLLVLLACVATGMVQAIKMIQAGTFVLTEFLMMMSLSLAIGLIAPAVVIPIIFWLGTEKGRFVNILVIVIAFSAIKIFMDLDSDFQVIIDAKTLVLSFIGIAAVVYIVSWSLTALIFGKKEY